MVAGVFGLCVALVAPTVNAGITNFWKSCDEQWKDAWENRDYLSQRPKDPPSCAPKDQWLKEYPGGAEGRAENIRRQEATKKRAAAVEVGAYSYQEISDYLGHGFHFYVNLRNRGDRLLEKVQLSCDIDANNAVRIYSGIVHVYPRLLPGRSAQSDMYFFSIVPHDAFPLFLTPDFEGEKVLRPRNVSGSVRQMSASCRVEDAAFEFTH